MTRQSVFFKITCKLILKCKLVEQASRLHISFHCIFYLKFMDFSENKIKYPLQKKKLYFQDILIFIGKK